MSGEQWHARTHARTHALTHSLTQAFGNVERQQFGRATARLNDGSGESGMHVKRLSSVLKR